MTIKELEQLTGLKYNEVSTPMRLAMAMTCIKDEERKEQAEQKTKE